MRSAVLRRLAQLPQGRLAIRSGNEQWICGQPAAPELSAEVTIHDPAAWAALAKGSIGAAESYLLGQWDADDLVALVQILARNLPVLDAWERTWPARLTAPVRRWLHRYRKNTRRGSRLNIQAHYDLGNEFYELWLDQGMQYSCAVFSQPGQSLEEAQQHKLAGICRKLQLSAESRLLEIGTGWGGLAVEAARVHGCHVTTTTISQEQFSAARRRILAAGLSDRVTLLNEDYRDLEGTYDRLVSVEMIEAVGHEFLPAYFRQCSRLLRPDGLMVLQAITIADQRHDAYRNSTDFIQQYIFPGGCLPSLSSIQRALKEQTDLQVVHLEDLGWHYAETLRHWRERFLSRRPEIQALGFAEPFLRLWEFYLAYCEGAFRERNIGLAQVVLAKPRWRPAVIWPASAHSA